MLTAEQIEKNYKKFRSLLETQLEPISTRRDAALALVDFFSTRLALAPASNKKTYHRAIPGGFVEHSLRVLRFALKLDAAFEWNLPKSSLVVAALFHDLGKLGDLTHDYYVSADDWKQRKLGDLYQHNNDILFMTVPHRSVWLCQHFGINLSQDELLALLLNDGMGVDSNNQYSLKENWLVTCIFTADYLATKDEKFQEKQALIEPEIPSEKTADEP